MCCKYFLCGNGSSFIDWSVIHNWNSLYTSPWLIPITISCASSLNLEYILSKRTTNGFYDGELCQSLSRFCTRMVTLALSRVMPTLDPPLSCDLILGFTECVSIHWPTHLARLNFRFVSLLRLHPTHYLYPCAVSYKQSLVYKTRRVLTGTVCYDSPILSSHICSSYIPSVGLSEVKLAWQNKWCCSRFLHISP